MKTKGILLLLVVCVLLAVIGYSGHQLWRIGQNNVQEAEMHSQVMRYRPKFRTENLEAEAEADTSKVNQNIVDLQETYSDAVGWLTVPNTKIDYLFVQGEDNGQYLHLDLAQRWAAAGTIFMDFRNSQDFSDFHTILYGHHMKNGSMFGTLKQFADRSFFEENKTATIFLADETHEIEWVAFAVIESNDEIIYNPVIKAEADRAAYLAHIQDNARYYRDVGVTINDRIVTLSTCSYEFHEARMVLIGKIA